MQVGSNDSTSASVAPVTPVTRSPGLWAKIEPTPLSLTRAGRAAANRIARWPDFLLRAVDVLAPAEQAAVHVALVKMIRTLQVRGEIPVSRMCVTCRFFRPNVHDDPETPHHCAYVDAPFGPRHLRLDCPEHEEASGESRDALWAGFLSPEGKPKTETKTKTQE